MNFNLILTEKNNKIFNIILNDQKNQNTLSEKMINELTSALDIADKDNDCLLYTSPSPRDNRTSRMPSSA